MPQNKKIIFLICSILFLMLTIMAQASDLTLERNLQKNFNMSRVLLTKIERALTTGGSYSTSLTELKELGESIRTDHQTLLAQFSARGEQLAALGADAISRHAAMQEHYQQSIPQYLAALDGLGAGQVTMAEILQLKNILAEILPKKKRRIHGNTPYRHLNLPARTPKSSSEIIPAYRGGNQTFASADLAATSEAPISLAIATLAESLHWNPVEMYEWVKNNVKTEWYWGCMKGAEETLRQMSGNDSDQAALLVALFRSAGFPARYVQGVIEFFPDIEAARAQTGLDDPLQIARYFQKAGIPYETVIAGGKISNFRIEHIWVEVEIPYDNYRGAMLDGHGKTWLPLDTSIKPAGFTENTPGDALQSLDLSTIREHYLANFKTETPLEYLSNQINEQLSLNNTGLTYNDLLLNRAINPEHMQIIPGSLQFTEVAVTGEYASLPDELLHKARFSASTLNEEIIFDQTLPLYKLSNRSIAVTFEPETIEDQEIMNGYGGLDNTPSYLIHLRPILSIDDSREIVGQGGLAAGSDFNLTVELIAPAATERVENILTTGYPTIIGLSAGQAIIPNAVPLEEKNGERLLFEQAMSYIDRGNKAENQLASLFQMRIARPLPTFVTLGGILEVVYLLDSPHGFDWKGLYLDADLRIVEPMGGIITSNTAPESLFMQIASLQNSFLEHRIFEDGFGVDSVSTAKMLTLASEGGIPVTAINAANVLTKLPALNLPESINDNIANAINQGYVITIPEEEIFYEDWFGFAWIKENPETYESGWMLSGEIAGGMTAWGLDRWPEYYKDRLSNPDIDPPNNDSVNGYSIQKITATDMQKAEVGTLLSKKLQVIVRDIDNNPVAGAPVTFSVKAGGGNFSNNSGTITITSDIKGIAEAEYTLGKCTETCSDSNGTLLPQGNPAYLFLNPSDTYQTQISKNIINASLDSGVSITTPFTHYALPGNPVKLDTQPRSYSFGYVLTWMGFVGVRVMDQYSNPVANVSVDFSVADPVERNACPDNPNKDLRPSLLIEEDAPCMKTAPVYGQCGAGSVSGVQSHTLGEAPVHVILGGMPDADYVITANAASVGTSADMVLSTYPFGNCNSYSLPWRRIIINPPYMVDFDGNVINAVKVGNTLPMQAKIYWVVENEELVSLSTNCNNGTFQCDKTIVGNRNYSIITEFDTESVTFDDQPAQPSGQGQNKVYDIMYNVGDTPAKKSVVVHADTTKLVRVNKGICTNNCQVEDEPLNLYDDMIVDVYAVDIKTDYQEIFIPLSESGHAICDVKIPFEILPAEYISSSSTVVLTKDGSPLQYIQAENQGEGFAEIAAGFQFDPDSVYTAQVVLNNGNDIVEIRSEEIPIRFDDISIDAITIEDDLYPVPLGGQARAIAETTPSGRKVVWSIEWKSEDKILVEVDPHTGMISVDSESASGSIMLRAADADVPCIFLDEVVEIGCQSCAAPAGQCKLSGYGAAELDSINFKVSLGQSDGGQEAGSLYIRAEYPSPALATPRELKFTTLRGAEAVKGKDGRFQQVLSDQTLTSINVIDEYSYEMDFYRSSDVLPNKTPEGLYQVADTATPLTTWRVENPDAAPDIYDTLIISQLKFGIITKKYTYNWLADLKTWTLNKGDGAQITSKEYVSDPFTGDHTVTETIKTAAGEIASVNRKVYHNYTWGVKLVEETIDPDGAALTTSTDYYDNTAPSGSIFRIKSIVNPDGSWVRYEYDEIGRKKTVINPWLDTPVTAAASEARATYFSYDPVDSADENSPLDVRRPRTVTQEIQGVVVSRTYYSYIRSLDNSRTEIVEQAATPSSGYGAAGNMRTKTSYSPSGTGLADSGKVASILGSDGGLTSYTYEYGTYTAGSSGSRGTFTPGAGKAIRKTSINSIASSPEGIANKTTSDTTITNRYGNTVEQYSSIYTGSGYDPYQWSVNTLDEFGRPEKTYYSDSTSTDTVWGCCSKDSSTDRSGITTSYVYDTMDRPAASVREGLHGDIATIVTYDATGRRLTNTVESQGLRQFTEQKYDAAGRLDYSIDATGLMTDYEYDPSGLTTTVIRPDGATEITTDYPDGRVRSVTGTGVVSQYYEYGVNPDGSQWTRVRIGSATSLRWQKTTTDMLGRTILSEQPGVTGTITRSNFYNDAGQLVRTETTGLAATIFEYDELGNQYRSGIDIDANTTLDLPALDRITETDSQYVKIGSDWWQESNQYVYAKENIATRTRTSTQRSRMSGFGSGLVGESVSIDILGNETVSTSELDSVNKRSMTTVDSPDATNDQISISEYGLPVSSTTKSGITITYDYDALGRRTGITNPRVGSSKTYYDDSGRLNAVEDAAGNRTTFGYDPVTGRKAWEKNALDKYARYAYNDQGQITHIWGDATYPVQYEYDSYGQRVKMQTYQGGTGWNAETWPAASAPGDTTTWHYDEATGLLTGKEDAAGKMVSYSYTSKGQLETRTWARADAGLQLSSTYVYDPKTSELTDIDYSDTTVDVSFSYDRLGRQVTVSDALGARTFGYTNSLQLGSETITGQYNRTLTRNYDGLGRYNGLGVDAEYTATYDYDPATGRFGSVSWNVSGVVGNTTYGYLPNSNLLQTATYSNGQITTYGYEPKRNLKTQVKNEFNANLISQYDYSYDAIGRTENVQNTGSAFNAPAFNIYGYNERNELTSSARYKGVSLDDTSQPVSEEARGYGYDNIGTRTTASGWDEAQNVTLQLTYSANQLNQYDLISSSTGPDKVPTYDDDGNMTGYGDKLYTYNGENRLVAVEPDLPVEGSTRLEFVYDYMGRRVQKRVFTYSSDSWLLTSDLSYLYDGWNMIAELDENGVSGAEYVWGLDLSQSLQGAGGVGGLLARLESGSGYTYTYDANGNVGQMLDGAGGIAAHYEYDPFGNLITSTGSYTAENPFRFSTKYFDAETDLYYYGYRYYIPELGRWLNRDPIGEQGGVNLYGFVGNDGVGGVDRLGLALYAFDGTANIPSDSTNVHIMYKYGYSGHNRAYLKGIGNKEDYTNIISRNFRQGTGFGLSSIRGTMLETLVEFVEDGDTEVDIIGFSRGAVTAITFAEAIEKLKKKGISPFCKINNIRFMGLYDPVPGPFIRHRPSIPELVSHTSIAYSLDEKRDPFKPSMYSGAGIVTNWFRGGHSDVGGGYKQRGLANISLEWMTKQGQLAGAPFIHFPLSKLGDDFTDELVRHQEINYSLYLYTDREVLKNLSEASLHQSVYTLIANPVAEVILTPTYKVDVTPYTFD